MTSIRYNKLVRDRIPDLINSSGRIAKTRTLTEEEFEKYLREKLVEETQEFISNDSIEELVDVFQVILSLLDSRGVSFEKFKVLCQKKADERGEFKEKLFLISIE